MGIKCCRTSKISNSVGRNDNFLAKARKLSIPPTSFDILIYDNTIYLFTFYPQFSKPRIFVGRYSATVLKDIPSLVLKDFLNLKVRQLLV